MNARTLMLTLLALCSGSVAAVGVHRVATRPNAASVETVPVVTVNASIPRGVGLTAKSLEVVQWPRSMAPRGTFSTVEEVVGRTVAIPMVKGDLLIAAKLAGPDSGTGLAGLIPTGYRAFTINTPQVASGVAGLIQPDDHVDVLLTSTSTSADDGTGGAATTTLLQNLRILAVDQKIDTDGDGSTVNAGQIKSVTLLVLPDQAAKLGLASSKGVLHLSLRNPDDPEAAKTRPATLAELRFYEEKPREESRWLALATHVGSAIAQAAVSSREPDVTATEVDKSKSSGTTSIVTLRGVHRGSIRVQFAD